MYMRILSHTLHSAQAHTNKSLEERERPRLALLQLNTFTNLIISVCAGPERFLAFSFSNVITCPTPPSCDNSKVQGGRPALHPHKRRWGWATGILKTVFMEVKHKQTNKGVCSQEALITATTIRVMRPDGRTV